MNVKTVNRIAWGACVVMSILWVFSGNAAASSVWAVGALLITAIEANR